MKEEKKVLKIQTSPHFTGPMRTDRIMLNVSVSLLPVCGAAVYFFGLNAFFIILTAVIFSLLAEYGLSRISDHPFSLNDYSALVTGMLLGLTVPPTLPLWMAALGSVMAITVGKFIFGGLGANLFNPALVGRAFLQAAFPVSMTTWKMPLSPNRFSSISDSLLTIPFLHPMYDAVSQATPLSLMKFEQKPTDYADLFLGSVGGSLGETSGVIILICGLYLAFRKMLDWRIPFSIFLTVGIFSGVLHLVNPTRFPGVEFMLFSGALFIGAVYMATDMVTSPVNPLGVWVYGILIGGLTVIIRIWGGLPEGVMYSILLGNALSPLIDRVTRSKIYGAKGNQSK